MYLMKTIFRFVNLGLLVAMMCAAGVVAGFGQNACDDAEGKAVLDAKFRENFGKDIAGRKIAVEAGKQFVEKYGACPDVEEFANYLKTNIPVMEKRIRDEENAIRIKAIVDKFNAGLNSKNWDEVYASGKQLLAENADDFRAVELVLGSIGLDETAKVPKVTKWNDDTLKYARMSISDLESGKTFKTFGVKPFIYKNKDDALGWMNYTIGLILSADKGNKKEAVGYLYKATQLASDTSSNPVVYETIGLYYFDELNSLTEEIKTMIAAQNKDDSPEVAKQKVDAIKAKVGQLNGAAERALDVYARAYKFAPTDPKSKQYRDKLYKNLQDVYKLRFEKLDGLDAWIASATSKPFPNPTTPITPVLDQDPSTSASTSDASATPATTTKPPAATAPAKPVSNPTVKAPMPTVKPSVVAKPQASVKKPVAKKKSI